MNRLWSWLTAVVPDPNANKAPANAPSPFGFSPMPDLGGEKAVAKSESGFTPLPVLRNPGKFDGLESPVQEINDVESQTWRGLQLNLQNVLHPNFVVAHQVLLGKNENVDMMGNKDDERSRYDFISFLKTKYFLLNGRIGTSGMTSARASFDYGKSFGSFQGQFAEDETRSGWQADAGYKFRTSTVEVKLQGPAFGFAYTQSVLPFFNLGTELLLSPFNESSRIKFVSVAGNKDTNGAWTTSYSTGIGPDQINLNYTKLIIKNLDVNVGTELGFEPKNKSWSSVFKLGYQYRTETGGSVRSALDSTGTIAGVLEEPLSDMMMVSLCAKVNHPKNIYDFGFGINVSI